MLSDLKAMIPLADGSQELPITCTEYLNSILKVNIDFVDVCDNYHHNYILLSVAFSSYCICKLVACNKVFCNVWVAC